MNLQLLVILVIMLYLKNLNLRMAGARSLLSDTQTIQLIEHLTEKTYFHTRQICTYVEAEFGVSYTVSGINKWLHHHWLLHGKKPKGVPHKLKPEEQQAFIEYYNEVLKPKDAPVLFMDAVHPTQSTKLSCGWIRKGQDKLIETTGSRTRVEPNRCSVIKKHQRNDPRDTYETIDSESIVRFFWKTQKEHYPLEKTVHIVLDGAAYHRSEMVRNAAKVLNIELPAITYPIQPKLKSNRAALESNE